MIHAIETFVRPWPPVAPPRWLACAVAGVGLSAVFGIAGPVLAAALAIPGALLSRCASGCARSLLWGVYPGAAAGLVLMVPALQDGWATRAAAAVAAVALSTLFAVSPARGPVADAALRLAVFVPLCSLLSFAFDRLA